MSFIKTINRVDKIGDSLLDINANFLALEQQLCSLRNGSTSLDALKDSFDSLLNLTQVLEKQVNTNLTAQHCQVRISLDPSNPIPYGSYGSSLKFYLHPYQGNYLSLYNTQAKLWEIFNITEVLSFYLTDSGLINGTKLRQNSTYDIYICNKNNKFIVKYKRWNRDELKKFGPFDPTPMRKLIDNVYVDNTDSSYRFIGCVTTTEQDGETEQTNQLQNSRNYLWNYYNRVYSTVIGTSAVDFTIGDTTNVQIKTQIATEEVVDAVTVQVTVNNKPITTLYSYNYYPSTSTDDTFIDISSGTYRASLSSNGMLKESYGSIFATGCIAIVLN